MKIAIITAGQCDNGMGELIQNIIISEIDSKSFEHKIFNIDINDVFLMPNIYAEIVPYDVFIFLTEKAKGLIRFIRTMGEHVSNHTRSGGIVTDSPFKDKKCLLIVFSGEMKYSFGLKDFAKDVEAYLYRFLKLKITDSFIFEADNGYYMMDVIPFAIRTLLTKPQKMNEKFIEHKLSIKFCNMEYMLPDIAHCLEAANIHTVGDLAKIRGEEIFKILDMVYDRVAGLFLVYLNNDIPTELLNDVIAVADNYRNQKLLEIRDGLRIVKENLESIGENLNRYRAEVDINVKDISSDR